MIHALESRLDLTVQQTDHRGHAVELAAAAARDGVDVVIVHGGDGTVHGVVNGLLGAPGTVPPGRLPAVAVVPGGSANVFARSLGIPADPIEATNLLIDLLSKRVQRRVGLIDCGERWAVFNAGMGVDGQVVAAVEAQRAKGRKVTASRYTRVAVGAMLASARRQPTLTLQLPGRDPIPGAHFVFVSNSSPWTYANDRPMVTNPDCRFETGLGVFAITSMKLIPNLRLVAQMFAKQPHVVAKHLIRDDDVASLRVTWKGSGHSDHSDGIPSQIDGDYIGRRAEMTFRSVPDALSVVARPV